jgi:hypothetical protein
MRLICNSCVTFSTPEKGDGIGLEHTDCLMRPRGIWLPDASEPEVTPIHDVNDPVDHPSHYTSHPSGVECIDVTEHMTFNLGNAVKYIWRAGLKDSKNHAQDLEKAVWYVRREVARLEALEKAKK